jgi:phosphoribosylglycinamide formyltransferase-1
MKLIVFAYNFLHRKTQDFLVRLFLEGYNDVLVLGADPVKLDIAPPAIRIKPRYGNLLHPRTIAKSCGFGYDVVNHQSEECIELINSYSPDVGIIAGARILRPDVINCFPLGVVNFHPAILPGGRGLDALQWAIAENRPIGVTAHLIDAKIDSGRLVLAEEIELFSDDSLVEISMRLSDKQVELLPKSLSLIHKGVRFPEILPSPLHRKMPANEEVKIPDLLQQRLKRQSGL